MTKAYYSAVLDHPLEIVWSLIRDFNNYPLTSTALPRALLRMTSAATKSGPCGGFVTVAIGRGNGLSITLTSSIS